MSNLLMMTAIKLDTLAIHVRVLVTIAVLTLIFILWGSLFRSSIDQRVSLLKNEISKTEDEIVAMRVQLESARTSREQDPNAKNRAEKAKLAFELAKVNEELEQSTAGFIEPKMMTRIMEELFARSKDLELIGMENIVGSPLLGDEASVVTKNNDMAVFRHGLVIEFKGNYLDTLRYLKAIENMPWKFYWGGLKYTVDEYPVARVTITLFTVSLNREWMGI